MSTAIALFAESSALAPGLHQAPLAARGSGSKGRTCRMARCPRGRCGRATRFRATTTKTHLLALRRRARRRPPTHTHTLTPPTRTGPCTCNAVGLLSSRRGDARVAWPLPHHLVCVEKFTLPYLTSGGRLRRDLAPRPDALPLLRHIPPPPPSPGDVQRCLKARQVRHRAPPWYRKCACGRTLTDHRSHPRGSVSDVSRKCLGSASEASRACSGMWGPYNVEVVDTLALPADLPHGEWVLGWRWDCEESNQVWASCSDVTIVSPARAAS